MTITFEDKFGNQLDGEVFLNNVSQGSTTAGSIILADFTSTVLLQYVPNNANFRTYTMTFVGHADDIWNNFTVITTEISDQEPKSNFIVVTNICQSRVEVYLTSASAYTSINYIDTLGNSYTTPSFSFTPPIQQIGLTLTLTNCITVSNTVGCIAGLPPNYAGIVIKVNSVEEGSLNLNLSLSSCANIQFTFNVTGATDVADFISQVIDVINADYPTFVATSDEDTITFMYSLEALGISSCGCLPKYILCGDGVDITTLKYSTCENCGSPGVLFPPDEG